MEKLPVSPIAKIAGLLILLLIVVFAALHFWSQTLSENATREKAPVTSPLGEVEFESGQTARQLLADQKKRLHTTGPAADAQDQAEYQQVSIEKAFDQMLQEAR